MNTALVNGVCTALATTVLWPLIAIAQDIDGDGISDETEAVLITRHLPVLVYEPDERHYPISVSDFVMSSRLLGDMRIPWQDGDTASCVSLGGLGLYRVHLDQAQLQANPLLALEQVDSPGEPCDDQYSSFAGSPGDGNLWWLDLDDAWHPGIYPGADGSAHRGMYAHVVPHESGQILLQYWQLFGFNEAECTSDCGDHEGDWLYLDLYLNPTPPYKLQSIVYHHHGDGNCAPMTLPYTPSGWPWCQFGYCSPIALPANGHPICFLEEQAHEWWPFASGGDECEFAPFVCSNASHLGGGLTYQVPFALNVGEWYAPTESVEAKLFVLFAGRWGRWGANCEPFNTAEPPDSPMIQFFPAPPAWRFVNAAAQPSQSGDGSARDPWRSLASALANTPDNSTLRILPGNYFAVGTVSRPVTLTAPLGPVTIGR